MLICRRSLFGLRILINFSFSSQSTVTSSSWDSYSFENDPRISTGGDSFWREFLAARRWDSFWRKFWRIGVSSFWNVQSQSGLIASFVVSRKQNPFSCNMETFYKKLFGPIQNCKTTKFREAKFSVLTKSGCTNLPKSSYFNDNEKHKLQIWKISCDNISILVNIIASKLPKIQFWRTVTIFVTVHKVSNHTWKETLYCRNRPWRSPWKLWWWRRDRIRLIWGVDVTAPEPKKFEKFFVKSLSIFL